MHMGYADSRCILTEAGVVSLLHHVTMKRHTLNEVLYMKTTVMSNAYREFVVYEHTIL